MIEIQLQWSRGIYKPKGTSGAGLWHPDTPENRRILEAVRDAGNDVFGPGTHWIAERLA